MELMRYYREHGYFDAQLYHFLEYKRLMPEDTMIIPSEYVKTMNMSTMDRLQNLNGMEINNIVSPDPTKPAKPKLEFFPRVIVFQNYRPNERIVTKLSVQNIHHNPTFLNMKFKPTSQFALKPVGSALLSRLAPGISASYSIIFTPSTIEDVVHEITFHTDTDKYVVGLIAMSPRLVFDFPDEITIMPTPLKVEKSTTVLTENISKTSGSFTVLADCPFSVYPRMITSMPGSQTALKVSIKTMYLGDIEGLLLIKYETGETFKIKVKGTVYSVGIELEKPVVRFLDTYNTMVRQQTFKITNKSNDELTFMCMKNPSLYEDFDDKIKLARTFYEMKDSESAKYRKLVQYDVLSSDEHSRVYTRIFFDEIHSLVADETLQFHNPYFSIMPIQGILWPNKTTEIVITFGPKAIGEYKAVAYLDIDGTQDRVPLTLQGTSLPPNIFLNVESLDIDNAYINKVYNYEIIAINRGHITGVIQYRPVEVLFGSVITCTPEMHCLQPGEKDVFVVSFLNSNQGAFFEELEFFIRDTSVVRKLYLKGTIIYPTLLFGVPCLDFNEVCVGVSKTLQVEVINESEVRVNASVKIGSDGPEISAITLEDCEAAETSNLEIAKWPKEFNITPNHIEFAAFSKVTLRVTLTANLARTNHTFLELELDKSDSPPITLPISFDAKVPVITPAPDIKLRACFVDFIYSYDLNINCDRYWGFFTILPPEDTEEGALDVQLGLTKGTIRPNTTLRLPCNIRATSIGKREHVVRMSLFGLRTPIEICHISAMGVKPIVSCAPLGLSYGQIKLLHRVNKTVTLNNDSPVAVYFKAVILHKDHNWSVSPEEGVIEAESDLEITVSVCLIDVDTYSNKVIIQLEKVKDICIPVSAVGYGTSIVVGNNKAPVVDIGRHFCKLPMTCYVPMKNCGTRLHVLDWLETFKNMKSTADEVKFFHLNPVSFKIKGGELIDLEISACAPKAITIKEHWHLVGSVEGVNKKELLMTCEIQGEFVDPKLIIFPTSINLRYDYGPYSAYYKLTEVLTIKNVSKLPLEIDINMKSPFAIIHKEGTYKCDSTEEDMCNCINYRESDLNIQRINKSFPPRDNIVFIDCLTKKPVPFEQNSLQFFQNIDKIKMAFNLTNTVQETLEDEEYMKIQILFDTTKHTNLKSKVYSDLLRIRLKGHKNKDAVKIVGVIHFPNVSILTPKIDFHCVLNGSLESRVIKLYNPTALLVCYSFQWKKCSVVKIKVPELSKIKLEVEKISVKTTTEDVEVDKALDVDEVVIGSLEEEKNQSDDVKEVEGSVDQASVTVLSTIDTEEGLNLLKTKMLQKIAPMIRLQKNPPLAYWSHKLPQYTQPVKTYNINDIFMLVPHQGKLKPDETHEIHIMFKPYRDFSIRALLKCKVLGGPSEIIAVSGQSSDLMYKLNTQTLNFKIRSFHENASENLIVTNIALYPIEYTTYLDEPIFENELPATILKLSPAESTIEPEEVAEVTVHMRVGILGYFSRTFILELGHLPHIPIEVFGWGVIPQVYLSLPRPGMSKYHPELGYYAIANLTLEYLDAVKDIFNKCSDLHLNSADPERCFEDPDFQEDWHICSAWDGYPSIMDIELAIERLQVVKHINARPEILKFFASSGRGSVIPGYQTTPYTLDFGVMITDTSVTCLIDMVNYGPTPLRVHFSKQSHMRYWLDMKLCTKLEPGELGKIEITFSPNSHEFREYEQSLDITYLLEVPYGVVIPLNVKSEIAVPFLNCSIDKVEFGSVRCGDKVIISIPLKNTGKPTCIWYVTLKTKTPGPPAMTVMESSGKYEPGEGGWLSVTFRPTMEITYEAALIFRFHMNHTKMVIPVKGNGMFPHVHIIGPNMNFPPTLPWSDKTELYFGITNPCPFPVEVIFAHVDEVWKEEEERLQLLFRYYNKPEEMLVPAFKPGDDTPGPIKDFFATFKKNVAKEIEAEAAAAKASAKGAKGKSTPKSPKKDKAGDKSKAEKDGPPAFKKRSEAEIVADVIKALKAQQVDPLKECIMKMVHKSTHDTFLQSGLIVFLYGSPAEEAQSLELAYTLGMKLALPTINFDSSIIHALLHSECLAKSILMTTLNDNYENLKKPYEDIEVELPPDLKFSEYQDDFEIIKSKIELFINSSLRNAGTPRSKMSDKKKPPGASGTATSAPTTGTGVFNQELLEELLKDYFSHEMFDRGFVMDSLTSYLLKSPSGVLTTTMRCKPSITNIHLALCLAEFSLWAHKYEEALHEEELAEEEAADKELNITPDLIAQIINEFDEMDGDEYENADPTLKAIYIQHGLEYRRQKYAHSFRKSASLYGDRPKEKTAKDVGTGVPEPAIDKKRSGRREDGKGKTTPEFLAMQTRYNEYYKNVHEGLIQIACNWVVEQGDVGYPLVALNGLPLGAAPKKGKKPPKSEITLGSVVDSEHHAAEKGFPLTLLMCPCLPYREAFTKLFTEIEYYIRMLEKEEPFNILECPPKRQELTVLLNKTMPLIHPTVALQWLFLEESPIRKCECNQITDLNLLDDTTQDNVLNILAKWHCVCGKKSSFTSTSYSSSEYAKTMLEMSEDGGEDVYFNPLPLRIVESALAPTKGRVILLPGDLMRCKFVFKPTEEGHYSVKRFMEVTGWPESRIDINGTGICDLPRLDSRPKKMFADFVRKTEEDQVYKHTFLDDLKQFVFGPIFIGNQRIYEEEYTIVLRNASLLPCLVTIEFINSNNDIYRIDKNALSLEPGERDSLTLSAAPAIAGEYENALLLIVKDNPEVVRINISCKGVVPIVEILPQTKNIDYGRVLLYRREDDRFIIKNDSELPVMWTARNPEDFAEDFIMPTTKGIIPQHENTVVPITYTACNVLVFSQLALIIDIYDALGRGDPMIVDAIYISGECYDVLVECSFDNPTDNFLNFGNVKVNSTIYREMYLANRGLYNIYFKLKKVKNFPEPSVLKSMEVDPECGVIAPGAKQVPVEFLVTPSTKVDLRNVPAYNCYLLDGRKDQVVVAKFPVCITIASFYNTFTLFPLGELNFHIIAVGTGIVREVILNNTSKCPFNYKILVPELYREPAPELLPESQSKPESQNKVKIPPLKCGNFLIMNDDNLLLPGQSKIIFIQFIANEPQRFQETIHFIVTDTCPAEADGVPLKLVGTGAMPTIDFWNLENTFREHLIVKDMGEYGRVKEATPHCVFVESSVMFYFFCVTVNTRQAAYLDLYNNGLVTTKLDFVLHYQKNTNADIISLEKDLVHIDSFQHWRLGIIFTPKALLEYRAVLEIKLHKTPELTESFSLCLLGEGVIPRIRIITPTVKKHKFAVFHFPVTCLGATSHQVLTFKNIGTVKSTVTITVLQSRKQRPVFWLSPDKESEELVVGSNEENQYLEIQMVLQPDMVATLECYFNPLFKGRIRCDVNVKIMDNPYEYFTILCEAEAFAEDVILMGLKMLSLEFDAENNDRMSSASDKKAKSAGNDRKKTMPTKGKMPGMHMGPDGYPVFPAVLKYVLDFGGCELLQAQKRTVIMVNNSEKVYRFTWDEVENIVVKPSIGYISPGEEKDIEIMFFTAQPIVLQKEMFMCHLSAISNDTLTLGNTWDNRQTKTTFEAGKECVQERIEISVDETPKPEESIAFIDFVILYSAVSEFTKYSCDLPEKLKLLDTYIYQKRKISFSFKNVGNVPLRVLWTFSIEDDYPARLDKYRRDVMVGADLADEQASETQSEELGGENAQEKNTQQLPQPPAAPETTDKNSKATLFSASIGRESVDTWFEMQLPFAIEPTKACLHHGESQTFNVTFSPQEAFQYKVCLKSLIDNLDPYDQNISCKIKAKALVPYVHLEIEECDYVPKNIRLTLPANSHVLMFKVLGAGCYKKSFNVVNPTREAYDYMFESVPIPEIGIKSTQLPMEPIHCDKPMGFVEGGMSDVVTFTFHPTSPGTYESQWKIFINKYDLSIPFLVVGIVSEPQVILVPTILTIPHCLVGFTHDSTACLRNSEDEELSFEYKAHTLMVDTGKNPIGVQPRKGILRPHSETPISIFYTPITDGPVSFKLLFQIMHMIKPLTLMVNALSYWVKPEVTYYICSHEHILDYDVVTRIHLEQTASTYERTVKFKLKNRGSITFKYEWKYDVSNVKKYLDVNVKPRTGWLPPDISIDCVLHFHLKTVPVEAFPLTLSISDGPDYQIALYAEIEKPLYNFASRNYDFGKCIIGAPDSTYKKNLVFINGDLTHILLTLDSETCPEIFVGYKSRAIAPRQLVKIPVYFRPKKIKLYEFTLFFRVNSLCEEIIHIRGEGIPLILDLYKGCQKSFNLGPVKLGEKIIKEIEVINHSQIPIEAKFFFTEAKSTTNPVTALCTVANDSAASSICLNPSTPNIPNLESRVHNMAHQREAQKIQQLEIDNEHAMESVKVNPSKCVLQPHRKATLRIRFRPIGLITNLQIHLKAKVLSTIIPLVLLSGSATGMSLCLSQNSLQFGRVLNRGCKILKVMLMNQGDFGTRFFWQPLSSDEFKISPMAGYAEAHNNVTFNIQFRPRVINPYVKVWANCNIENYKTLDLAMYGACLDIESPKSQTVAMHCRVRETEVETVTFTNPTEENWYVISEISGDDNTFETLREFTVLCDSSTEVPITFKPMTMGMFSANIYFAPLGESALSMMLTGEALPPNPNDVLFFEVEAKKSLNVQLMCRNQTERHETYAVQTELMRVRPENFDRYYEVKCPQFVKCWGQASAPCNWSFICFEPCEMIFQVLFIQQETLEYQYYEIGVYVTPSEIISVLKFCCRARESVEQEVSLSNPLNTEAHFTILCEAFKIKQSITLHNKAEAKLLTMVFTPLVVGEFEDYLTIHNELVGTFMYRIEGICYPAKPKKMEVSTPLGTSIPLRLRVINKTDILANFVATTSHPSIITEKEYGLEHTQRGKFLVYFEPTERGAQHIRVSFNCPVAGEFVFEITGHGTEPKPQGPIDIPPGLVGAGFKFKNVFPEEHTFRVFLDNEDFYIKKNLELIKSKETIVIQVYLTDVGAQLDVPPTGCLTIANFEPAEPNVQWNFFLQARYK